MSSDRDPGSGRSPSSASLDGGRFAAGTLLAARYRIVGLVGRGAMGEVYRAEDLTLGEHVALKFLPARLAKDPEALARLHREVRTSRQVTHRNVVRVHDVGEVEGDPFLSMEFVRGEDLAALLRRIGRLPEEKGVALARQLCAGLAAAHERGVLHRDLKPGNVMVDADGNARLTDFGLAALTEEAAAGGVVGTPAYMAPEQLQHGAATTASDIFSLGLVLYEVFAGEPAIRATTLAELEDVHRAPLPGPRDRVSELDPAIDDIVRRCIEAAPAARPASPLRVAAALPGGDPLAQALAAGETPSPELVAQVDVVSSLPRLLSAAFLCLGLAGFLYSAWQLGTRSVFQVDGTPLEPAVLSHRAREVLALAQAPEIARGFGRHGASWAVDGEELRRGDIGDAASHWPPLVEFVYRAGERPIAPTGRWSQLPGWNDPPTGTPGTAGVRLDSRGRLLELVVSHAGRPEAEPDEAPWSAWFEASLLQPAEYRPVAPTQLAPVPATEYAAWESVDPSDDSGPARVEAARLDGRVVWWRVGAPPTTEFQRASFVAPFLVFTSMLLVGGWFAARNLRSRRADPRGASALATTVAALSLIGPWLAEPRLLVDGGPSFGFQVLAQALLFSLGSWLAYVALEPALRRTLPRTLTSWNRLIRGRWGDPLVHRDLFLGIVAGLAVTVVELLGLRAADPVFDSYPHGPLALLGIGAVASGVLHMMAILVPVALLFLFGVPRLFVRAPLAADVLGAALVLAFVVGFGGGDVASLLSAAAVVLLARRVGLVGLIGFALVPVEIGLMPFTLDLNLWWALPSLAGPLALLALLVATGARTISRAQIES